MSILIFITFVAKLYSNFQDPIKELYFKMRDINASSFERIGKTIDEERHFFNILVFVGVVAWLSICACASFERSLFFSWEVFGYYFATMMTFCLALLLKSTQIQLRSLNEHFKAMLCVSIPEDNNEEWQNIIYRNLCSCVKEYLAVARLTKLFVERIWLKLGLQLIFLGVLNFLNLYFFCLQCLTNKEYFQFTCALCMLLYAIVVLWIICAGGQRVTVTDESERLTDEALNFPWLSWNTKNRKALLLVLTMVNTPIDIYVRIFKIDYALAMNMMRMSFSYALTIYQMKNA